MVNIDGVFEPLLDYLQIFGSITWHAVRDMTFWNEFCITLGGQVLGCRRCYRRHVNNHLVTCWIRRFETDLLTTVRLVRFLCTLTFFPASRRISAARLIRRIRILCGEYILLTSDGVVVVVGVAWSGGCQLRTRVKGVKFVDWCIRTSYAYNNGVSLLSLYCWCSTT